jgi:hypothetical protein
MSRISWTIAGFILLLANGQRLAFAEEAREIRQSCGADYREYCSGGEYDPIAIQEGCLRQHYLDLSIGCRETLDRVQSEHRREE